MKIGDLIKYVCEVGGERCGRCCFCAPHHLLKRPDFARIPSKESTRIGLVIGPCNDDGSFDCQFDFGVWDVWPNEVLVLNGT